MIARARLLYYVYIMLLVMGSHHGALLHASPATATHQNPKQVTKQSNMSLAANKKEEDKKSNTKRNRHKHRKHIEPKKTITTMNLDELREAKNKHLKAKNKKTALNYVKQMIKIAETDDNVPIQIRAELTLECADLNFDLGKLLKAEVLYNEFNHLYPGHKQVEYASYRAVLCSFYATLDIEHDQTKTRDTIELADKFLSRSDIFTTYADEVKKIREQCYQKLVDSELNICSFFAKRGEFAQAEQRLASLRTNLLPHIPTVESRLIAFESELNEIKLAPSGFDAFITNIKKTVASLFPSKKPRDKEITTESTKLAAQNKKHHMRDRF